MLEKKPRNRSSQALSLRLTENSRFSESARNDRRECPSSLPKRCELASDECLPARVRHSEIYVYWTDRRGVLPSMYSRVYEFLTRRKRGEEQSESSLGSIRTRGTHTSRCRWACSRQPSASWGLPKA